MRESWLGLVDRILLPARPGLERCLEERERHLASRRLVDEARARALAECEQRIEAARAKVFAANDGVVTAQMTSLEREWRRLSRPDPEAGLMDLWARIAPPTWIDRKRFRSGDATARLDAAVLLAADVDGVEAAEGAAGSLREALGAWGVPVGSRIRWRVLGDDCDCSTELLAEPLRLASEGLRPAVLEHADQLEREVYQAMSAQRPDRPLLARSVARAAFVDAVCRAAARDDRPDPVAPLRALWTTGYVLADVGPSEVTLAIPPLRD